MTKTYDKGYADGLRDSGNHLAHISTRIRHFGPLKTTHWETVQAIADELRDMARRHLANTAPRKPAAKSKRVAR